MLICLYTEFMPEESISTWILVGIIFGATLISCLLVTMVWYYCQKRKIPTYTNGTRYAPEDSVYDPILNGNTLHDIIEMTTSGSGSGEI